MNPILLTLLASCITAQVKDVHDGDTFFIDGQMVLVTDNGAVFVPRDPKGDGKGDPTRQSVRPRGYDSPETRSSCKHDDAEEQARLRADERQRGALAAGALVGILGKANQQVELCDPSFDRHGRILAHVWVNGTLLSEMMVETGHAQMHVDASTPKSWCGR